jgi:hypothetical protein
VDTSFIRQHLGRHRRADSRVAGTRMESGSETIGRRGMTSRDHLSVAAGGGRAGRRRWLLGPAGSRGAAQMNEGREFGVAIWTSAH